MAIQHVSQTASDIIEAARALAPLIQESVVEMETERRLPPQVVEALRELGAFRLAVPSVYGGPELDPMTQVRVVEELSRLDGSVGWCAMISSAGSFTGAFLTPAVAQRVFGSRDFSLAGQVVPVGCAELVDGGYRVTGRYRFGSGCQHASAISAGCVVFENGQPRQLRGRPEIRMMMLPPSACKILDTWHTTGLAGTGSHDFEIENVFVPFEESWSFAERPHCSGPLYRFPPLFLVTHAGVPLGIARAAIDAVIELASHKELMSDPHKLFGSSRLLRDESRVHEAVAVAEGALAAARGFTYSTLEELWETLSRHEKPSPRQRALYRIMLIDVHRIGKEVVSSMYDLAATSAIYRSHPLDRLMRDILTACQHGIVHPKMYRPAGRLLLGLESGDPLF